jgi:hypothetical protein
VPFTAPLVSSSVQSRVRLGSVDDVDQHVAMTASDGSMPPHGVAMSPASAEGRRLLSGMLPDRDR